MRISDWSSDVCSSDLARGPSWGRLKPSVIAGNGYAAGDAGAHEGNGAAAIAAAVGGSADPMAIRQATLDSIRALMLIRAYRVRGHLYADLDPLGLHKPIDRKSTRLNSSH